MSVPRDRLQPDRHRLWHAAGQRVVEAPVIVANRGRYLRGLGQPSADVLASLLRAVDNIGAYATVRFESYQPVWPYRQPTTALTEVVSTLRRVAVHSEAARTALERLAGQRDRFSKSVLREIQHVLDEARPGDRVAGPHRRHRRESGEMTREHPSCCATPSSLAHEQDDSSVRVMLEDQGSVDPRVSKTSSAASIRSSRSPTRGATTHTSAR